MFHTTTPEACIDDTQAPQVSCPSQAVRLFPNPPRIVAQSTSGQTMRQRSAFTSVARGRVRCGPFHNGDIVELPTDRALRPAAIRARRMWRQSAHWHVQIWAVDSSGNASNKFAGDLVVILTTSADALPHEVVDLLWSLVLAVFHRKQQGFTLSLNASCQ